MTEKSLKYLSDVLMAIALIENFIDGITDFQMYEDDFKTQSAVERQLAIIGEALNKFSKLEPNVQIQHDKSIIAFINRLIHAYDSIDNSIVWAILHKHLQPLKIEVESLSRA